MQLHTSCQVCMSHVTSMHELVMSHVDEIFHVWMCPITYWWVVANMNESCHMWITSEYVLSCVSHVIYEWPRISLVMCVNVSWHIGMSCIDGSCNIFIRHITCSWGISRVNKSCYMWIRHVTYEWGMSHVIEAYGIMMMISFTIILGEIIQWLFILYAHFGPYLSWHDVENSNQTHLGDAALFLFYLLALSLTIFLIPVRQISVCQSMWCVASQMFISHVSLPSSFSTLFPFGDNDKIHVCWPMITSNMWKLNIKYVFDTKLNQIK